MSRSIATILVLLASGLTAQGVRNPPSAVALEASLRARLGEPLESLDLETIMFGEDFCGAAPEPWAWSGDGKTLYFRWKRWDEREKRIFAYDVETRDLAPLGDERAVPDLGTFDAARKRRVYEDGEALMLHDLETGEVREVLRITDRPSNYRLDPSGKQVFFVRKNAFFRLDLESGALKQLLALGKDDEDPKDPDPATLAGWHTARQRELFRRLVEKKEQAARDRKKRRKQRDAAPRVPRYEVPEGWAVETMTISPSGLHLTVGLTKGPRGKRAEMPDYVTASGYTESRSVRAKVGDATRELRLDLVDVETGKGRWLPRPKLRKDAALGHATWSADGRHLLLVGRTDDDTALFIESVDPFTGEGQTAHFVLDAAWVQWGSRYKPVFLGASRRAVFLSEADGWSHLYRVDAATGEVVQLTKGRFEVTSVQVAPSGDAIYAIATPTSPHVQDLVRIDPETGDMTILTADGGGRRFRLSPDGSKAAEVFSKGNRPWELRVRDLTSHAEPVVVTDSPSPAWKSYGRWEDPEIVWIPADDGVKVPARIYRPEKPHPKRPAVLFVHGAGYLQNVHHWWSSYYREYAFHHLLRDAGYLVLDVDYRGSRGYGRDWRTAIYGHMGGRDLDDFVDAARWLAAEEEVDPERIGIYGGSYGGFITLMGLFTKPGVFAAGAALRPVTDWAHYNDGYTSNILDDPLESPVHYDLSSPINFAEGLEDHLLICHGMLDDNVHVQGVFRLQQRLIELRKKHWEVALYPLEGHGFVDAASWTDEYSRIKTLFDRILLR